VSHSIECTLLSSSFLHWQWCLPPLEERDQHGESFEFSLPFVGMRRVVAWGGCVMSSFNGVVALVVINGCLIQCCLGFYAAVIAWRNKMVYACGVKKEKKFFLFWFFNFFYSACFFFFAFLGEFSSFSLFATFSFLSSFFLFVFPLCFFFIAPSLLYFFISSSSLSLYPAVD